jgi:hypothetical protein
VVVPLVIFGAPSHGHLTDVRWRRVLAELAAALPAPPLLLRESVLPNWKAWRMKTSTKHAATVEAALRRLIYEKLRPSPDRQVGVNR